jgi:hypothetical protein
MITRAAWTRDEKPEYYGYCHIAEFSTFGLCNCQSCWRSVERYRVVVEAGGTVGCKIAVPPHCGLHGPSVAGAKLVSTQAATACSPVEKDCGRATVAVGSPLFCKVVELRCSLGRR